MTSEKQIESNRRNAQLSTGPKTPEGKTKVSNNALTLGLHAKKFLVPNENEDEYFLRLEALYNAWEPQGLIEEGFVIEIADTWLKIDRLKKAEQAHLSDSVHIETARRRCDVETTESRYRDEAAAISRAIDRHLLPHGLKMVPEERDLREALKYNVTEPRLIQIGAAIEAKYQSLLRTLKRLEAALTETQDRRRTIDARPQRKGALQDQL